LRGVVERAVAEAGIGDRVLLPGIRGDVPDLLRAMDVMVMTSLWEGLPRVVLQALATGIPVVSYDVSGIDECLVDGRTGYLVPPGDVDEMAERLGRLAEDPSLCAEMGRLAREELGAGFSEDAMILELERLYGDIMSGAFDARDQPGTGKARP
jgi:glycosyltransferase involved in cell wall biosynthesis